jgi:hypothetical protein
MQYVFVFFFLLLGYTLIYAGFCHFGTTLTVVEAAGGVANG